MFEKPPNGRTREEDSFILALSSLQPGLDYWQHDAADGSLFLIVSHDFAVDNAIHDTLRLDFDGTRIRGGWSPAFLNWDDGVPAADTGIDTSPPDGIAADGTPAELARAAAAWFAAHIETWDDSDRAKSWPKASKPRGFFTWLTRLWRR